MNYQQLSESEIISQIEDESLDIPSRSRALEFLASVDTSPEIKSILKKFLVHADALLRESAGIAAISHPDFDLFMIMQSAVDSNSEIESVKQTFTETISSWFEADSERSDQYQKLRSRILLGTNSVELIEYSGDDLGHALSAWTSTSRDLSEEKRARVPQLLNRLAKEGHHTPFEKSYFRFLIKADTASHIHLLKHRIGVSINGESARYKELKDDKFYIPQDWDSEEQLRYINFMELSLKNYHEVLSSLVSRGFSKKRAKESARFYLPYGNQITLDASFNFRSFMHFQSLRNSEHAQIEIKEIAKEMLRLVKETGNFNHSLHAFGYT